MNILGISGGVKAGNQDGSAALILDGKLVAAAEEERFTGIKFANGLLPRSAIKYCLEHAHLRMEDIDLVVFPGATWIGFNAMLERYFRFQFGFAPPIELVDHHTAHAASTYFGSGWQDALVITMDFSGDGKSTTVRTARGGQFTTLTEFEKPDSLGIFYSTLTQFLGFQKDSDEYKVMGMAAYGHPRYDFSEILEITDSAYRFHWQFLQGVTPGVPAPSKQEPLFEEFPLPVKPRVPGAPILQEHYDVAASGQIQLERALVQMVRHYARETGLERVCLAGGVSLNCLMNQRIRETTGIKELYVPPICSDAGLALGCAYLGAQLKGDKPEPLAHAYWGPEYEPGEIKFILDRAGAKYQETSDPAREAVQRIAAGKIIGWFQGRMEYGPRALGNRSILADPRLEGMKDEINHRVKFREEFRPVAPSIPHELADPYFQRYVDSPYMTQTFTAAPLTRQKVPAVVHADGTSRLQSVHRETNPLYHDLITRLGKETDVPMVINTSLNAYNDPMACEPHQAMRTFYTTGLDSLILGNFVLDK